MKRALKKGFTLVELVVVIAIIAILSAVSVVTYVGLTNKAKESSDISLVSEVNKLLQLNEIQNGKANTYSEAIEILKDDGIDLEKLSPNSSNFNYVYDAGEGKVLLLNEKNNIVAPSGSRDEDKSDTFAIAHKEADLTKWIESGYGVYAASDYTASSIELAKLVSIDIAETSSVNSVTITDANKGNAIVNGDLDSLTITAPKGTVDVYGDITTANAAVANDSLHVYGHIQQLNLTQGRVVASTDAVINTVDVSQATANVKVEIAPSTNGTIGTVIVPQATESSTVVVEVPDTIEEVEHNDNIGLFAGGVGTKASPYLIGTVDHLKAVDSLYIDIDTTPSVANEIVSKDGFSFKLISDIDIGIGNYEEGDCIITNFVGSIDGDNHTITSGYGSNDFITNAYNSVSIRNLNILQRGPQDKGSGHLLMVCYYGWNKEIKSDYSLKSRGELVFENITVSGNQEAPSQLSNNTSSFLAMASTGIKISFLNCTNHLNIDSAEGYSGIFIGGYIGPRCKATYINCVNTGTFTGAHVGFFTGNSNTTYFDVTEDAEFKDASSSFTGSYAYIKDCRNDGVMMGSKTCDAFAKNTGEEFAKDVNSKLEGKFVRGIMIEGNNITDMSLTKETVDGKTQFKVNTSSNDKIAKYVVTVFVRTSFVGSDEKSYGTYNIGITCEFNAEGVANGEAPFISKVVLDADYSQAYDSINATEKTDTRGNKYKLLSLEDGSYCAVFRKQSLIDSVKNTLLGGKSQGVEVNLSATISYNLTAYNSDNVTLGVITNATII